jgi:thiamine-monophosphate kinase
MARWSEKEAVELLRGLLGATPRGGAGRGTLVGIGDDAAVIAGVGSPLVLTIDACVEHVHFERAWLSLEDVGWRATNAAVSDLAAMGARPLAALSNVALPPRAGRRELAALGRGQAAAASALSCPIVGGNLTRAGELSVTTAVIGTSKAPLLRSGARPGDELWCVGELGLAAAGLAWLQSGRRSARPAVKRCVESWRRPQALLAAGRALAGRVSACCDVSDGLARDAAHLAEASGACLVLEEPALRAALSPALVSTAELLERSALAFALEGGEDYALLCTGPAARRPRSAKRIGRVMRGRGVIIEAASGQRRPAAGGFDHLR